MREDNRRYVENTRPIAYADSMVCGEHYRITVLTNRLLRLEYQKDGAFVDEPTQRILNRQFEVPQYSVKETMESLEIITDELHLYYDKKEFSAQGLRIVLNKGYGVYGSTWIYGEEIRTLGGTARTLDNVDGPVEIGPGLLSRNGYTLIDDSTSALLNSEGWVAPRKSVGSDLYFFGYGHDYLGCLKDFYQLCGPVPMLPKYALGNWWSRFYAYRQQEYLDLMDRFHEEGIPFSVSVMDMDWHRTQLPEKYGSGWTGYSWNKELFPEPQKLLQELHEKGLHVTLNLHPADGVKGHEDNYLPMAKAMGVDYKNEERMLFDVTDEKFMDCYFKYMHHPHEEDGVDFWWLDWQQESVTRTPGIDALWMLNHLHYIDHGRDGKTPLIFSRYAGIGSHRYPVGFSGDTVTSWESLRFQPYFTATASNVGYSWWSHDIGGHMMGRKDDELVTRWIQFGVFSPIMRLHSTSNQFYGKEPWNYGMEEEKVMKEFLRLRHRLIPYLYNAVYRNHEEGIPLMLPMYYKHDVQEAYQVPNEYYFGESLIVVPVTDPMDKDLKLARTTVWLPEGTYYNYFSHNVYEGGRYIDCYNTLATLPIFAKAGAILPLAMDYESAATEGAGDLELQIFTGDHGHFILREDEGRADITYAYGDSHKLSYRYEAKRGNVERNVTISFFGVSAPVNTKVYVNGKEQSPEISYDATTSTICLSLSNVKDAFDIEIWTELMSVQQPQIMPQISDLLHRAQISFVEKERISSILSLTIPITDRIASLHALHLQEDLFGAILELLTVK